MIKTLNDIITGEPLNLVVDGNPGKYELMQRVIRISAIRWTANNKYGHTKGRKYLDDVRIFEKYAKKYGLQTELREQGII